MIKKTSLLALALPVAYGGYIALHPGIAYAETPLASLAAAIQGAGAYTTDAAHTSVGFEIDHLGIARVQGRFAKTNGKIQFDPKNVTQGSVNFTIATDSIDTAIAPRDTHLKSADFFDAAKYPEIKFQSTKVRKDGERYVADGNLTIKDVTKPVSIPFTVHGPITDPWGKSRIGVIAEPIKLNRQDYNVAYNDKLPSGVSSVGDEVTIRLSVEATLDAPTESN
ncbi:MAG TPA: YceI family protein [Fimbriimonas sp.]